VRFDLSDLRLFLNVVEAGSITHGAEHMHLAIAAASTRIRNMEAALGTPLLHRGRQGVQPTPAGRTLVHHARLLLQQAERMHAELAQYAEGIKGQVRLLSNTNALTEFLPEPLSDFLAAHPQVNIDLEERLSDEIVAAVADGTADIGKRASFLPTCSNSILLGWTERARCSVFFPTRPKGSAAASNCAFSCAALMRYAGLSNAMSGSASSRRPPPSATPTRCRSAGSSWRTTGRSAT
jgi:DNA-binding transcriptional LysR family regulator